MGVFSHCQIALDLDSTQVTFKEKQVLRKQVTNNGGVISYILTKKTSYLVSSDGERTADSYKGRTAQKQGVPIVGRAFIQKCLEEGRLLDHDDFLLVGKTASMEFSSGKITTSKTQQEQTKQVKTFSFNLNKLKAWPWGSDQAPSYPEDKYEVVKSVLFQKVNLRSKEETFYQLELHVVPDDVANSLKNSNVDGQGLEYSFRVFRHQGVLHSTMSEDSGTRDVRYCHTSEEALELYSFLYGQHKNMMQSKKQASRWIGSPRYRQNQLSIGDGDDGKMSQEVASLVADLWKETLGELEEILAVDIKTLTAEKVSKAESILLQIKKALTTEPDDANNKLKTIIDDLSQEFYQQIPHNPSHRTDIKTKSGIAKKQDLCQLIKDAVSVSETTNWSVRSSVESKYRALRCHISCLPHNHPEYYDVKNLIISTQGMKGVEIRHVFAVTRPLELTSFDAKLHNSRLLFHASRPANFVGILSRGLILPKVVVDDFGGERTDAGMLGSGIYFADNFSTSAKYSHMSHTRGTRLMMVNQVALGECYDTSIHQKDFTQAPDGFHSVHGVRNNGTNHSDFKDDEYAVYNTKQQCSKYLVEFALPDDKTQPHILPVADIEGTIQEEQESDVEAVKKDVELSTIDLSDVQSIEDPLAKVQPGLLSSSDQPIPLKAVHVRARLLDLAAQVVVLQVYANDSDLPIEAKFVFPLDEQAAVCGFEAFINDKHIVGEVKEKETAHKEYKEAISRGHGAYLMDEEKPDVFTVSVGNLPPKTTVVIKITYVAELSVDGDKILFVLPGSVAPWRKDEALAQETQTDVTTVKVDTVKDRSLSVAVAVEMPYDILSLESPTHPIKHKRTATKATVSLAGECRGLDDGFQLLIGLAEIHVPRMWVEKHPDDNDSQACMLTFYPEFEAKAGQSEVVFLLDLSNSMRETESLKEAQKIVLLTLHCLPKDWRFNIVVFGTDFDELFPQSKVINKDTLQSAVNFLRGLSATMGNTDVWRPLRAYFMLRSGLMRNVFFVSDGHVSNEDVTLEAIRTNCRHTRVFTFGVSATANKYLLRAMSSAGAGAFEFFDNKTKSKWEGKVKAQLSKASQPVLSSVSVDWCQFDDDAPAPVQAPNQITSLFSGSRQVVYGFVPYCTQATLRAKIDGKEVSTMVSTHELSITQGKILHQLTARNVIRDWEEGSLAKDRTQHEAKKAEQKTYIISLSKKYSIVTQFTSFVAVEVRDKSTEGMPKTGVDVADLLKKEEVDALSYLEWQGDISQDALQPKGRKSKVAVIEELAKQADIEANFSVHRCILLYTEIIKKIESWDLDRNLGLDQKIWKQLSHFVYSNKIDLHEFKELADFLGDEEMSYEDFAPSDSESSDDEIYYKATYYQEEDNKEEEAEKRAEELQLELAMEDDLEDELECCFGAPCIESSEEEEEDSEEEDEEKAEQLPYEIQEQAYSGASDWMGLFDNEEDSSDTDRSYSDSDDEEGEVEEEKEEAKKERRGKGGGDGKKKKQKMRRQESDDWLGIEPMSKSVGTIYSILSGGLSSPVHADDERSLDEMLAASIPCKALGPRNAARLAGFSLTATSAASDKLPLEGRLTSSDAPGDQDKELYYGAAAPHLSSLKALSLDQPFASAQLLKKSAPVRNEAEFQPSPQQHDKTRLGLFSSSPLPTQSPPQQPSLPLPTSLPPRLLQAHKAQAGAFSLSSSPLKLPAPPPVQQAQGGAFSSSPSPPKPPAPPPVQQAQAGAFSSSPSPPKPPAPPPVQQAQAGAFSSSPLPPKPPAPPLGHTLAHSKADVVGFVAASQPPLQRKAVADLFFMSAPAELPTLPSPQVPPRSLNVASPPANVMPVRLGSAPPPPLPPEPPASGQAASLPLGFPQPLGSRAVHTFGAALLPPPRQPPKPPASGQAAPRSFPRLLGSSTAFGGAFSSALLSEQAPPPPGLAGLPPPPPPMLAQAASATTSKLHGRRKMKPVASAAPAEMSLMASFRASVKETTLEGEAASQSPLSPHQPQALDATPCENERRILPKSVNRLMNYKTCGGGAQLSLSGEVDTLEGDGMQLTSYSLGEPVTESRPKSPMPGFTVYERLQAILAGGEFDSSDSVFRENNGRTDPWSLKALLEFQDEAGWWSLKIADFRLTGVKSVVLCQILKDAGIHSLGEETATKIEHLVATYLVILHLKSILEGPSGLTSATSQMKERIVQAVLKAERWLSQVEAEHPSMTRQLELGNSWDQFCRVIFTKI